MLIPAPAFAFSWSGWVGPSLRLLPEYRTKVLTLSFPRSSFNGRGFLTARIQALDRHCTFWDVGLDIQTDIFVTFSLFPQQTASFAHLRVTKYDCPETLLVTIPHLVPRQNLGNYVHCAEESY